MACDQWLCLLPTILAVGVPITIFTTYGLAVRKDHVYAVWPYISDTGSFPPESCIFSQFLNLGAFIVFFVIYLRYRQVREYIDKSSSFGISRAANISSLIFGMLSCLGLDVVANFQEANVITVHLLGAALCFISGTIYTIFQAIFTRKMKRKTSPLFWLRVVLSITSICSTILAIVPVYWAVSANKGGDFMHWQPHHPGYAPHVVSTVSEWILVFSYCLVFGSLLWDFKDLRISEPLVKVVGLETNRGHSELNRSYKIDVL